MRRRAGALGALLVLALAASASAGEDWLAELRRLGFWERLAAIQAVSEAPQSVQQARVPALVRLLGDEDQSVRLTAAAELAEIRAVSAEALPSLIASFSREHGEEGAAYVDAVAAFGARALPLLEQALASPSWLVRARACDAVRKIEPRRYLDGECKRRAP